MDTGLNGPSKNQIKKFIQEHTLISFKLLNGEIIKGKILCHDKHTFFVETEDKAQITLCNQALLYYFACK